MADPIILARKICLYAALTIAVISVAKLLGVNIQLIKGGTTELAAIGILCALVGR